MRQFKIYTNPQGSYEAVKQGWSWPAFFFVFIWAVIKKMWALGVGFFAGYLALGLIIDIFVGNEATDLVITIVSIIIHIIFGHMGNDWRENNLIKRGYKYKGTLDAFTPEGAVALFFEKRVN